MSSAAPLFGEIFEITRGDLENACFQYASPAQCIGHKSLVRLAGMAEFWKERDGNGSNSLLRSTEDFVTGLFGQECSWAFFLRGTSSEIACWLATDPLTADRDSMKSLVRGSFADVRFSEEQCDLRSTESLRYSLMLTGTPSQKDRVASGRRRDQLQKLCRGLFGENWMYLVEAAPQESAEIARGLNVLSEKIRDVRSNFLLKASAIDEDNRTALRYVELLEAKLRRYERGRVEGMWSARCVFFANQPEILARARHILAAAFSGEDSLPDPIRVRPCSAHTQSSPVCEPLTSGELALLTCLPEEDFPGFELIEYARFGVEPNRSGTNNLIRIGEIVDRGTDTGNWLSIPRNDLTKHGLIVGITGSGKTNSCFQLLDQVWDGGKGVPFLVVESAKSEYRALLGTERFRAMRVFTVGDDTLSPLRLNPFEVPPGILVQTHIDYIKSLFSAAFVLYPPMPYVLEQSIQEIYEDRGWDVARNTNFRSGNSSRSYPILADLAAKIPIIVDRMGYEQRIAMDVKAGLLARINQLRLGGGKGLMLGSRRSTDAQVLFESPCLLELKQIVSDDEKAFIIGLLLIRLYEHREMRQTRTGTLAHLTLIEEAHRLLRNVSTEQNGDTTNPKGRAIEVFANILSEIRAFGESIVVAEQIPVKLTPDVVKNTGFKLIHRLVAADDRELVGRAVNLTKAQLRRLATLETGQAVAWTEHTRKAVLLRVPLAETKRISFHCDAELPITERRALLPYEGCSACPESESRGCLAVAQRDQDETLLGAFRRVINAFRLNQSAAAPAFAEFRQLTKRGGRSAAFAPTYCQFVALAETDIERRGEFRGWRYSDVDWFIASACSIALLMDAAVDRQSFTNLGTVSPEFQTRAQQLDAADDLPYPGCRLCEARCQFRFDMTRADRRYGAEFRGAFVSVSTKNSRLVEIALNAATNSFFHSDQPSVTGAAFCFGVQQLAKPELELSMYYQNETAVMLKKRFIAEK